jgi:nitrogen regulatory protein P-II 2
MAEVLLVTVVAEAVLEPRLLAELKEVGAHGWTVSDARGEGPRNRRTGDIAGGNVRIESLMPQETADNFMARLAEQYFPNYACIAWVHPVSVMRPDKFT